MEPGIEPLRVAERRKVAPGAEERLLGGVLSTMGIAQDPVRQGVAAIHVTRRERRERLTIACRRLTDELLLLHPATLVAASPAASPSMEPANRKTFRDRGEEDRPEGRSRSGQGHTTQASRRCDPGWPRPARRGPSRAQMELPVPSPPASGETAAHT